MKLTAAKFALLVFVLLALGMFAAAAPQLGDSEDSGDTGSGSPVDVGTGDDTPTTPVTGKNGGGGTTTGGSKSGSDDTNTGDNSPSKTPAKSGDEEEPSAPPSRTGGGGSRTTPDEPADDNNRNDDATSKTPQSSGSAKNNNDNDDNDNRNTNNNGKTNNGNNRNNNNNNNNNNGNNRNRNDNNNEVDDTTDNAKDAKNTDTDNTEEQENTAETDPENQEVSAEPGEEAVQGTNGTKPLNATCTSDAECESGICEDDKCVEEKEDEDKTGKTLGMALGIIVAVMCIGMVLLTAVRMIMKRRRSDYYSKRISELAAPSRATTPSFYHDSSSLVLEKQARNGNYAFNSPDAAISSDSVRPPAQGYVYGAADGYDMDQAYTRTGMPTYTNDQHMYAPNAPANDWAITPTYGAFPTGPNPNPIPVPQPVLPVPAMSPIPQPRNVQPAADPRSNNALGDLIARDLTGGAGDRDSELIMYGGAASQNLTRESMYDASDDQNDGSRYKMNSIYSAYGRDSLYADTKDTPSVPDVPDLPSQYQKRDNY